MSKTGCYVVQFSGDCPGLLVKNLTTILPGYSEMRQAGFPFSMLDEKVIAPHPTLSQEDHESMPVFVVQANFVKSGLLFVFNAQHNCMDLGGQVQLIELFSRACRGESFNHTEREAANLVSFQLETTSILRTKYNTGPRTTSESRNDAQSAQDTEIPYEDIWAYFHVSATSLHRLKQLASHDRFTEYISTDDALSALLWQAVLRSRQCRIDLKTTTSNFQRQVNARTHVGAPAGYLGNMVYTSRTILPLIDMLEKSLGQLASHLRESLNPDPSIKCRMQHAATSLQAEMNNKRHAQASTRPRLSPTDIKLSSWAQERCCDLDLGAEIGKPEAVRRPSFEAWAGLAYFMPKDSDGSIAVAMCLREDDLARLRSDEEFCGFCTYVG